MAEHQEKNGSKGKTLRDRGRSTELDSMGPAEIISAHPNYQQKKKGPPIEK